MTQLFLCYAFNIFSTYKRSNIHDVSTVTDDASASDTIVTSLHTPPPPPPPSSSLAVGQRDRSASETYTTTGHDGHIHRRFVLTRTDAKAAKNASSRHTNSEMKKCLKMQSSTSSSRVSDVNGLFLTFLLCLPLLFTRSNAVFPCLSSKCHCVFKSNKLIAECIGFNGIPEVSRKVSSLSFSLCLSFFRAYISSSCYAVRVCRSIAHLHGIFV